MFPVVVDIFFGFVFVVVILLLVVRILFGGLSPRGRSYTLKGRRGRRR